MVDLVLSCFFLLQIFPCAFSSHLGSVFQSPSLFLQSGIFTLDGVCEEEGWLCCQYAASLDHAHLNPADYCLCFHTGCFFVVCLFVWYVWIESSLHFRVCAHFETFFRALMLSSLHSRVCAHFETFLRAIAKLTLSELHFRVCANFETFFRAIAELVFVFCNKPKLVQKFWFPCLICFGNGLWNECVWQAPHYAGDYCCHLLLAHVRKRKYPFTVLMTISADFIRIVACFLPCFYREQAKTEMKGIPSQACLLQNEWGYTIDCFFFLH